MIGAGASTPRCGLEELALWRLLWGFLWPDEHLAGVRAGRKERASVRTLGLRQYPRYSADSRGLARIATVVECIARWLEILAPSTIDHQALVVDPRPTHQP